MALTLWSTAALVVWIVLWAIGAKPIDSAMLALLIFSVGVMLEIGKKYVVPKRD